MRIRHRRFINDEMIELRLRVSTCESIRRHHEGDPKILPMALRMALSHMGYALGVDPEAVDFTVDEQFALLCAERDAFTYLMSCAADLKLTDDPTVILQKPDADAFAAMFKRRYERALADKAAYPNLMRDPYTKKQTLAWKEYAERIRTDWYASLPAQID